jgi:anti-anti-sigma factor
MSGTHRDIPSNVLSIRASMHGRRCRLQLGGPLSLRTTDRLDRCLVQLRRGSITEVELDLQELTRLDSAGVALLLRLQHQAPRDGWSVAMVAPPDHLRHQLTRMGVAARLSFISA